MKPEGYLLLLHENSFQCMTSFHGRSVQRSMGTGHHESLEIMK